MCDSHGHWRSLTVTRNPTVTRRDARWPGATKVRRGLDLADIARHIGHSDTSTTAEYVKHLGNCPLDTALRAAELLDPTLSADAN